VPAKALNTEAVSKPDRKPNCHGKKITQGK